MNSKNNLIVDLTEEFAIDIISFSRMLRMKNEYDLSRQLFRSGTSFGANVAESQHAESRNDFIHKIKIASKEARETAYWLKLCRNSEFLPENTSAEIKLNSIEKVLSKILSTSQNIKKQNQINN